MPKARKPSADPIQEALRSHKAEFNDATKEFIALLKGFKNGLNGRGDPKEGIPPSKIQEPLPGEVSSLLSSLTSHFQSLVGGAKGIISEQESYSKNRRKKQPKRPKLKKAPRLPKSPTQPAGQASNTPPPVSEQPVDAFLANVAYSDEYMIEKYASSKLTRMWQYMKSPFNRDDASKMRIGLLSLSSEIYEDLLDLENDSLSLDIETIPTAVYKYQMVSHSLDVFRKSIVGESATIQDGKLPSTQESKGDSRSAKLQPSDESDDANLRGLIDQINAAPESEVAPSADTFLQVLNEVSRGLQIIVGSSLSQLSDIVSIKKLINKAIKSKNPAEKLRLYNQIEKDYESLIMIVDSNLENEPNEIKKNQLKELVRSFETSAGIDSDYIIKLSHNYITRLLKKYWLNLRSSNKTAMYRLQISKSVGIMKDMLQRMMDSLEKTTDKELLIKQLDLLDIEMKKIHHNLSILNILYRKKTYEDYSKQHADKRGPKKNQLMDQLIRNEIRRDVKTSIL